MFSQFFTEERRPKVKYDEDSKDYENDDDFGDEPPPCMMIEPKKPAIKKSPSKIQPAVPGIDDGNVSDGRLPQNVPRIIEDDVTGKTKTKQGASNQLKSKLPSDTSYVCMHRPRDSEDGSRGRDCDDARYSRRVQTMLGGLREREDAMLQRNGVMLKRVELLTSREGYLQVSACLM